MTKSKNSLAHLPCGNLEFAQDQLNNCCGISEVGGFDFQPDEGEMTEDWNDSLQEWVPARLEPEPFEVQDDVYSPGTGIFISSFTDSEEQRIAYEYLKATHKLIYQSPLRRNPTTGNMVFLCVYLHADRVRA